MPIRYRVNSDAGLIETRCVGDVRYEEVFEHFAELEANPDLPERLDLLLDLTEMESTPESGQLRSVADDLARFESKIAWGACAIVANSDLVFGLSRMFQVFAEAHFEESTVVRDRSQAMQWLGSQSPRGRS